MGRYDSERMKPIAGAAMMGKGALDVDLLQMAKDYKTNVAKRYRLLTQDDIKIRIREEKVYCSVKIDGQFSYLYHDANETFIFNYSGRVVTSLPVIEEARAALFGVDSAILACELYLPDDSGRSRVYDVTEALGSGDTETLGKLRVAAFDVLELNGERQDTAYYDVRHGLLQEHLPAEGRFHRVDNQLVDTADVNKLYVEHVVRGGHEGLVARSAEHTVFKIKPRHNIDVVVVGFTERPDSPGTISALLTAFMRTDGSLQLVARVGNGFSEVARQDMFELLKPLQVESLYNETDGNHTLFTMVKPVMVVEMQFLDILAEHSSGRPLTKAVLSYEEASGYDVLMPEAFVALIAPIFVRIRDDKQVTPTDLRLTQLRPYVDLDNLDSGASRQEMAQSEVISRSVFTKVAKELTSVRKFVCGKTNKDEIDPSFPAYVFCYVDFSPGRAKPRARARSLRASNSRAQIEQIYANSIAKNVKKGWNPVDA
jgi:ATP-dependent DNA ligase